MDKKEQIRLAAEHDLETFIRLVHPNRVLGAIHSEILSWWTREDAKSHQLLLLPRDHQKSALVAYRVAWAVVRNPAIRILYISATSNLAIKQLKFIKDILTSDTVRRYWPELVNIEEAKREKWTETEISVDHPLRKAENVRDPTIFTAGLTTTITGLHCDVQVLDDVVVKENAYTDEGRTKVSEQYSLLASVGSGEFDQWVVGTRYHPQDLYTTLQERAYDIFNDAGEIIAQEPLYEIFGGEDEAKRQVEDRGDGTGEFLWPRQRRLDGKWFGFDRTILSRKKAQYLDRLQFYAQYYNNPNDPDGPGVKVSDFQYYDKSFLRRDGGAWYFKDNKLNVFAAIDFAFTLNKRSDYTAIVVIGIDYNQNIYVLDIDRFKSDSIKEYFDHILRLHQRWGFLKLRAEITSAQEVIVKDLKNNYIRKHGLSLSVDDYRPTRNEGTKAERVAAVLRPRYENKQIWHYHGGNCQALEEELVVENPPHDDVKDCLASVIDVAVAPSFRRLMAPIRTMMSYHPRFGGV